VFTLTAVTMIDKDIMVNGVWRMPVWTRIGLVVGDGGISRGPC